jgi:hypothetical protein
LLYSLSSNSNNVGKLQYKCSNLLMWRKQFHTSHEFPYAFNACSVFKFKLLALMKPSLCYQKHVSFINPFISWQPVSVLCFKYSKTSYLRLGLQSSLFPNEFPCIYRLRSACRPWYILILICLAFFSVYETKEEVNHFCKWQTYIIRFSTILPLKNHFRRRLHKNSD